MQLNAQDVVLFAGDSITDGARGHKMDLNHIFGHGYAYMLASELALENADARPKFINKGRTGYTMAQLLEKWQEDVLNNRPTILSLLAGSNDGLFGFLRGDSPQTICKGYRQSVIAALDRTREALGDIPVLLLEPFYFPLDKTDLTYRFTPHPECEAPLARPDRDETQQAMEIRTRATTLMQSAAREISREKNCIFVPLQEAFTAAMAASKREYFTWDGTHPTIAGHALIAREWRKAAEEGLHR